VKTPWKSEIFFSFLTLKSARKWFSPRKTCWKVQLKVVEFYMKCIGWKTIGFPCAAAVLLLLLMVFSHHIYSVNIFVQLFTSDYQYCRCFVCFSAVLLTKITKIRYVPGNLFTSVLNNLELLQNTSEVVERFWNSVKLKIDLTTPICQMTCNSSWRWDFGTLRSADIHTYAVPQTQSWLGDRNSAVIRPWLWNNLPVELWQWDILLEWVKALLKTLFS